MEEMEREARMLAEAQQRQQRVVGRTNQIEAQKQQLEMERAQLTQEALKLQGRIETLQELTREEKDENNIIPFARQEAQRDEEGEAGSEGND